MTKINERTEYMSKLPVIVSTAQWQLAGPQREPPAGMDYREYLCCLSNANWECEDVSCVPVDPFEGTRRFAPRRDHGVVVHDGRLFVLGGRARSFESMNAGTELVGGISGQDDGQRESTHLMSDVWASADGAEWELVNPGCWVTQSDLLDAPGRQDQQCRTTAGCEQRRYGNTRCESQACVCNIWAPREGMGVASFDGSLFVIGGSTYVTKQRCGKFACGGGFRKYLNDVWSSPDGGTTWIQVRSSSRWKPRRSFATFTVSGTVYIMGGLTGDSDVYASNAVLNDVWFSADGELWEKNQSDALWGPRMNMGFASHGNQLFIVGGQAMLPPIPSPSPVVGPALVDRAEAKAPKLTIRQQPSPSPFVDPRPGETLLGDRFVSLDDVWQFDIAAPTKGWSPKFATGTVADAYIDEDTPLTSTTPVAVFNLSATQRAALTSAGLNTISDVLELTSETLAALSDPLMDQSYVPQLCSLKAWARQALKSCEVTLRPYDGEIMRYLVIEEGLNNARDVRDAISTSETGRDETTDPCAGADISIPPDSTDVVCRTATHERHSPFVGKLRDKLIFGSGYSLSDRGGRSDVWFRDETPPVTTLQSTPTSGTYQSIVDWTVSEAASRSQYRLWKLPRKPTKESGTEDATLVRDWTWRTPPLDLADALTAGYWRFEVRSVDAAGNRDMELKAKQHIHTWEHVPEFPWLWVIMGAAALLILLGAWTVYYRRRKKLRLMRKHARKRMERKMRGIAKGDIANFSDKVNEKTKKSKKKKAPASEKDSKSSRRSSTPKRAKSASSRASGSATAGGDTASVATRGSKKTRASSRSKGSARTGGTNKSSKSSKTSKSMKSSRSGSKKRR